MYFNKFPQFLYDFNYGDRVKTSIVTDITRNVRLRKEILNHVTLFDEYDIIDGETPELISEKFYGTPEYHWVVMLANEKYDYRADFPMPESVLIKHIASVYNPKLYSTDWYWDTGTDGNLYLYTKITSTEVPFDPDYLTAPVKITIQDDDKSFVNTWNFPTDPVGLDVVTQYFSLPLANTTINEDWLIAHGAEGSTYSKGVGISELQIVTEGREFNPVYFVDQTGNKVNPAVGAIAVTGDIHHRYLNDEKRRIKIISASLLETLLKNYEDIL